MVVHGPLSQSSIKLSTSKLRLNSRLYRTSVFLLASCWLRTGHKEGVAQYEWYVPITDDTYELGGAC